LIGGILFVSGIYQKIEVILGFGAILPFSGLAAGVAGIIVKAKITGETIGHAIKSGLMLLVFVVGTGMIAAILIYLITSFIGHI
jgi:hypothetical protein